MIYKIPIYIEVVVEGDFVPNELNAAVDIHVTRKILTVLNESGGFPHSSKDVFDNLGHDVKKAAKVKGVQINLINRSIAMKKIVSHE